MESVFEAFISNPALYSAGHLVGETLHFPTNTEEVQSLLKRIGVDGVRCQEYFIISFDSDILGLMTIWASMKTLTSSTTWPIC